MSIHSCAAHPRGMLGCRSRQLCCLLGGGLVAKEEPLLARIFRGESAQEVTLRVWAPHEEHGDWVVRWTIFGLPSGDVWMFSGGVDSVQAMVFALAAAGDRLASEDDSLTFIGGEGPQLLRTSLDAPPGQWLATVAIPTI